MYGRWTKPAQEKPNNSLEARVRRVVEGKAVDHDLLKDLERERPMTGTEAYLRSLIVQKGLDRALQNELDKRVSATGDLGAETEDPGLVSGQKSNKAGRNGNVPPVAGRFKPGQSGNPSGRPSLSLTKMLRDLLEENDGRYAKALVRSWLHAACYSTNVHALREVLSRIEGGANPEASKPAEGTQSDP